MSVYESSITNPKKQLEFYKDLSEQLQQENQQLKEDYQVLRTTNISLNDLVNSCQKEIRELKIEINKISKKELKVMAMLRSIELCTLTKERIDQIEEVMFELGDDNE